MQGEDIEKILSCTRFQLDLVIFVEIIAFWNLSKFIIDKIAPYKKRASERRYSEMVWWGWKN